MNKKPLTIVAVGLVLLVAAGSRGETDAGSLGCGMTARVLATAENASPRQYAADREVQVLRLALDVTPDFLRRTISAQATLRFKPTSRPVQELKLDAIDLDVRSVEATEKIDAYQVTAEQIIVTFSQPLPPGKEVTVTIHYTAEPKEGLYFRTPELGIYAVYPTRRHVLPKLRALVDFLAQRFAGAGSDW